MSDMATVAPRDRLRQFVDVLIDSLDDPVAGAELARRVFLSRFHFDRLVRAALGESPAAFRRRLLLERAAYGLGLGTSVTEAALSAGYGSPEAFTRAFRRAFGTTPSEFRAHGTSFRLSAPNGVHFHPPGGVLVPGDDPRRRPMDLAELMVEHDNWLTGRLIEDAAGLPDAALDEPVPLTPATAAFQEAAPSIRAMLARLVATKEMWSAAIVGRTFEGSDDRSLDGMRARLERAGAEFVDLVRAIAARGSWDTAFVDASCDPPETFTFGGSVAHVLSWGAHRRHIVASALRERGVDVVSPDPIAWERRAR
jgi:AraC family transcriptional regulator